MLSHNPSSRLILHVDDSVLSRHKTWWKDTQRSAHSLPHVNAQARSSTASQKVVQSAQSARTPWQSLHLSARDGRVTNADETLRTHRGTL
jgi:hypothetical protein